MIRRVLPLAVFLLASVVGACGSSGVGDPCTIPNPPTGTHCAQVEVGSCFSGQEIYIETQALQCRTRVCMIYQWDQNARPDDKQLREFCTCKCGGPGDPSTFCNCPSPDFQCTTAFVAGDPGIQGSYCVRSAVLPDAGTGADH